MKRRNYYFSKLFLTLVVVVLLSQAFHTAWSYHLGSDVNGFYYPRALHFLEYKNLTGLADNEYQPGAIMFFTLLSPVLLLKQASEVYLNTVFAVNVVFIFLLALFYKRLAGVKSVVVFSLILLFTGPIIFYRFELLMALIIISSIYLYKKKQQKASMFVLGVATMTKIYPVILAPYFLLLSYKTKGFKKALANLFSYLAGMLSLLSLYMLIFKVSFLKVIQDMSIHAQKPVHVESVWGSLLTMISKIVTGRYALGRGAKGIFGIASEYTVWPVWFYNYFWLIPLGVFYIYLLSKLTKRSRLNVNVIISAILLFLLFSKILTAQYLLWFALLFPLLVKGSFSKTRESIAMQTFLILMVSFLSQYVYPLKYNELLGGFYRNGSSSIIFYMLFLRNALLFVLLSKFLKKV